MTAGLIEPPDTDLARWAAGRVTECCEPVVIGHCQRSYQFAAMMARSRELPVDAELLYLGVILHDLAVGVLDGGDDRFEVRGANQVRADLRAAGMSAQRAETVWDVIALHSTGSIAAHKGPETCAANAGIAIDVVGRANTLAPEFVRAVLDAWPRADFPRQWADVLVREVCARPGTAAHTFMESIAARHVDGYQRPDFLQLVEASASFA